MSNIKYFYNKEKEAKEILKMLQESELDFFSIPSECNQIWINGFATYGIQDIKEKVKYLLSKE